MKLKSVADTLEIRDVGLNYSQSEFSVALGSKASQNLRRWHSRRASIAALRYPG